jgi:arylsulfatase A-like enzyme
MTKSVDGPPGRRSLSARSATVMAVTCGLCGGYVDLGIMTLKKLLWYDEHYFWTGRDFLWSVPVAHAVFLTIAGLLLAGLIRLRPGLVPFRAGAWGFLTLALWLALLRAPVAPWACFVLAAGTARVLSRFLTVHAGRLRRVAAGVCGVLLVLASASSGRDLVRERRELSGLPIASSSARNVVLIVWDTVRASDLSAYGYPRDTTPNLAAWTRLGVRYDLALAPAPWTFPSHCTMFTGLWPYQLDAQRSFRLRTAAPTLAEVLTAHGYQTAGFAANTNSCSWESGLDRGFLHYEDYPLTLATLLGRTVAGNALLRNVWHAGDYHAQKWIALQSRDAAGLTDDALAWIGSRRRDRPFFAFLNLLDAHGPYVPPYRPSSVSGASLAYPRDYQFLTGQAPPSGDLGRDIHLMHDAYNECIAYMDYQFGRLMEELNREGLLENTLVIVTADHGEAFGDHPGIFTHANSVYLDEVGVPLVMIGPGAPAGRQVPYPVSLRDLPATVLDQLGLAAGSPLPGHSLAAYWRLAPGAPPPRTSEALSELVNDNAFVGQPCDGFARHGFRMALAEGGWRYVRDGMGTEELYDLRTDPFEMTDLVATGQAGPALGWLRARLLETLRQRAAAPRVETAYLKAFRDWLEKLVRPSDPGRSQPGARAVARRGADF